jgi:hypothetical protein
MFSFAGDDARDVGEIAARGFFAENVQAAVETGDRHFGRDVVSQAHEKNIERLVKQPAVMTEVTHAIRERTFVGKGAVAHGNGFEEPGLINKMAPSFPDDAVAGDADAEGGRGHVVARSGAGVR